MDTETKRIDPYRELPFLKRERIKFSSNAPFTPSYVISSLTQSSDPEAMYMNRVQKKQIMLEIPVRESKQAKELREKRARQKAQKEKKKLGIIGKREAKEKGVWNFNKSQMKFELFIPLHRLWQGYMSELLNLPQPPESESTPPTVQAIPNSSGMHPKLVKADFHGSIMTVRQSKNTSLIGVSGIVIHETENVFKVVTSNDKVKVMPKQNSIFAFAIPLYSTLPPERKPGTPFTIPSSDGSKATVLDLPHMEFELHGNQFCFRSADRAGRKFKHKETVEL